MKDELLVYNSVMRANVKLVPNQAEPLHATAAAVANEPSESVHPDQVILGERGSAYMASQTEIPPPVLGLPSCPQYVD